MGLPYTRRLDGQNARCDGHSVRYALISLLGLAKTSWMAGDQGDLVNSLWRRIAGAKRSHLSAGDLGLGLWAQALHGNGCQLFTAHHALRVFLGRRDYCSSIDLAWLLLGADFAFLAGFDCANAEKLAGETRTALLALYHPRTNLFYRHARRGPFSSVSRRIACFANQSYPIMALAVHGRYRNCQESSRVAADVADRLCSLQGHLGQWWWLYDVCTGHVVEQYPVFSVHQDGMAPMALLQTGWVRERSFAEPIGRGLQWLFGANELGQDMVLPHMGLILRDIHRQRRRRVQRMIHGAAWCCGWRGVPGQLHSSQGLEAGSECRPYHLGWVLYAAGLALQTETSEAVG